MAADVKLLEGAAAAWEAATAAKDAEIERLRAAVEAVWAAMPRDVRYLDPPDGGCVPLHEQVRRMAADATRAERLAEALRGLLALPIAEDELRRLDKGIGTATRNAAWLRALAALRDHDQEVGNG